MTCSRPAPNKKESFKCNITLQLTVICNSFMKFYEVTILIIIITMFISALSLR